MIRVEVGQTIRDLQRGFAGLSKQQVAKASSQAINQTLLLGRTRARKAVKQVYNIPQRYMARINYKPAKPSILQGHIYASSKPIPMDAFSPKYTVSAGGQISKIYITRRGVTKVKKQSRAPKNYQLTIEVQKGKPVVVPYAFLIPGAKPRVFARGEYKSGNGSYGFIQRHIREENSQGNDSVKPLTSVTVFAAVINPKVKADVANIVKHAFEANMIKALRRQANAL